MAKPLTWQKETLCQHGKTTTWAKGGTLSAWQNHYLGKRRHFAKRIKTSRVFHNGFLPCTEHLLPLFIYLYTSVFFPQEDKPRTICRISIRRQSPASQHWNEDGAKLRKICGKTLNQQHRITTMQLQQDAFGRNCYKDFWKIGKAKSGLSV